MSRCLPKCAVCPKLVPRDDLNGSDERFEFFVVGGNRIFCCSENCYDDLEDLVTECNACGEFWFDKDIHFATSRHTVWCPNCVPTCNYCSAAVLTADDADETFSASGLCPSCIDDARMRWSNVVHHPHLLLPRALYPIHPNVRPLVAAFVLAFDPRDWLLRQSPFFPCAKRQKES